MVGKSEQIGRSGWNGSVRNGISGEVGHLTCSVQYGGRHHSAEESPGASHPTSQTETSPERTEPGLPSNLYTVRVPSSGKAVKQSRQNGDAG